MQSALGNSHNSSALPSSGGDAGVWRGEKYVNNLKKAFYILTNVIFFDYAVFTHILKGSLISE